MLFVELSTCKSFSYRVTFVTFSSLLECSISTCDAGKGLKELRPANNQTTEIRHE